MFTLDFLQIFLRLIVVLINIIGIWLIILVNSQKINRRIAIIFTSMVFLMFLWVDFAFLSRNLSVEIGLLFIRIAWAITPFFFFSIFYFVAEFFKDKIRKYSFYKISLFFLSCISIPIVLLTNSIIKNIYFSNGVLNIDYGPLSWPFFGIVIILTLLSFYILSQQYSSSKDNIEKRKIEQIMFGFSFFFLMNAIFNIILPVFFRVFHLYYLGDYSTVILIGFIAYAVLKNELFGTKVVLTSFLVGIIAILLGVDFLIFTEIFWLQVFKGVVLVLFIIFGYFLIKNINSEVKRREQLEKLTKKLKRAYKKLEQLDKAKSEFISIASHQLRTPLTAIKGYVSMILEKRYGEINKTVNEKMEKVFSSTERLNMLINTLLNISRIEAGRVQLNKQKNSLKDLLESIINELQFIARDKNIKLELKKSRKKIPLVLIDEGKIKESIINIIDNAIKYSEKGKIKIELDKKEKTVIIKIKDQGIGMKKKEINNLFTSFTRGKAGNKFYSDGAGLGLYISKKFIKMHDGKIWAESEGEGKGSTFFIELPFYNFIKNEK